MGHQRQWTLQLIKQSWLKDENIEIYSTHNETSSYGKID